MMDTSYGTIHRSSTSSSSATIPHPEVELQADSTKKQWRREFGIPSSPEAAAVRIIRNFSYFALYYTLVVWVILFVSLVPKRHMSLLLLVLMTFVTSTYLLLLRVIPYSVIFHKIINKHLVLALLAIGTAVELIITRAGIHLLVSLSIGIPIILFHAVLRVSDDHFVNEEVPHPELQADSTSKQLQREFDLLLYFGIPSSPEVAAVRIIRNFSHFSLYYTLVVWVILSVSLVPKRHLSLLLLGLMTFVTSTYLLLLRVIPYSVIFHKIINKHMVLALLAIGTAVELIITHAGIHLLVSLSIGIPIILFHAVLRVSDDHFANEASAAEELVTLLYKEVHQDHDSQSVTDLV